MTGKDTPKEHQLRSFGTGAVRANATNKGRYDLLPSGALHAMARVFEFGATKYSDRNWERGIPASSFIDSCRRHIAQHMTGDRLDAESGLPHIWHALTNLAMLVHTLGQVESEHLPNEIDDTPKLAIVAHMASEGGC